jgi:hypothetical protein
MTDDTIDIIRRKLAKYPQARFVETGHSITVLPSDERGFEVGLAKRDGRMTVYFDGWHEELDDQDQALNCFALGLSPACRLRVEVRGHMRCKWVMEYRVDEQWYEDSTVGLLLLPFWRRPKTIYLQNQLGSVDP